MSVRDTCFFRALFVHFSRVEWWGREEGPTSPYCQRRWFWHASQRTRRASTWDLFRYALSPFNFYELGGEDGKEVQQVFNSSVAFKYACQRVRKASVQDISF